MEEPLSRVEAILQNILGADNVLVPPQSRVEAILLAILNNTEYIHPGDPSRVEEILLAIKDGGSYDKKALSRMEDILIHKLNDEEYTDYSEDDLSRVEKLLIQWIDLHPEVIKELTTSSFPISILANGLPLLDYTIYGNSVQNGTPTPDNPIEPEFCGDLVSIELDEPLRAVGDYKDNLDLGTKTYTKIVQELVLTGEENWIYRELFNIKHLRFRFTNSGLYRDALYIATDRPFSNSGSNYYRIGWGGDNYFYLMNVSGEEELTVFKSYLAQQYANNTPVKIWYVLLEPIVTALSSIPDGMTGVIEGTVTQSGTPTPDNPIEPVFNGDLQPNGKYQVYKTYKIPISSAGQTKTIYLGQVQTTRRIKKLVLTGEETVALQSTNIFFIRFAGQPNSKSSTIGISNQYQSAESIAVLYARDFSYQNDSGYYRIRIHDSRFETPEEFKSYLAQQYAAGTPVIVWCVLAEPETGIVNEPLCRIGDYADSVDFSQAGVEIPTLKKPNTTVIDVKTEVEPSSMYLKYAEPSDGPAPKTPVLGTKDREIYVTPNNEVYVLRR